VRFGVAHELYAYEQNWVEVDGDGKYAKPLEDPQTAYARRYGKPGAVAKAPAQVLPPAPASMLTDMESISCPKCGGRMWDNRLTKRNPKAPDYKCQNRSCDGVIWPPKATAVAPAGQDEDGGITSTTGALVGAEDEIPF
jgi:hypothetical protein